MEASHKTVLIKEINENLSKLLGSAITITENLEHKTVLIKEINEKLKKLSKSAITSTENLEQNIEQYDTSEHTWNAPVVESCNLNDMTIISNDYQFISDFSHEI